jgi:release factor glutamine methyltransferase
MNVVMATLFISNSTRQTVALLLAKISLLVDTRSQRQLSCRLSSTSGSLQTTRKQLQPNQQKQFQNIRHTYSSYGSNYFIFRRSYASKNDECPVDSDSFHNQTIGSVTPSDIEHQSVYHTLQAAIQELTYHTISEPILSAVNLLSISLKLSWTTGYRDLMDVYHQQTDNTDNKNSTATTKLSNRLITVSEQQLFRSLLDRRLRHEPVQYLCGQWDFLDYTFTVRSPLLCPRPETEELVLLSLEDVRSIERKGNQLNTPNKFRILDIGCGTGCIGIALADKVPQAVVTAIDIEPIAIATSMENAARVGVIDRYSSHLIPIEQFTLIDNNQLFDLVVSNPPYIPPKDMVGLQPDVLNYESHVALDGGGSDGLDVIRSIVHQLPIVCKVGGICWMEVDPTQPTLLREWLSSPDNNIQNQSNKVVQFLYSKHDMFGQERFVKLRVDYKDDANFVS